MKALRPWREDIADHRKASGASDYLCSQCQTLLPAELGQTVWTSSLPRIMKHRKHCRLCRLLLDTLCVAEYDPFKHPQVAKYLNGPHIVRNGVEGLNQEPVKEKSLRDWLIFNQQVWPFGDGKALPGEESRSIESDSMHRMSKLGRSTGDMTLTVLVNLGLNVASAVVTKGLLNLTLNSPSAQFTLLKLVQRHLPCYIEVKRLPLVPGTLDAKLRGYGRGPRAQLATLSHFRLKVEAVPTYTYSIDDQPALNYAFVLDPARINVARSRMWLEHCEQHHGSKCKEQGWSFVNQPPDFVRLIDVERWCLVAFQEPNTRWCRYVALSYVWGGAQNFALDKNNTRQLHMDFGLVPFLDEHIPKTIRDAMLVVRRMGQRYLWVDALCIQQDDRHEKHAQIESMDRIYGNAIVTLVAADSLNANAGIPGVLPGSREVFQPVAKLDNGENLLAPWAHVNTIEQTLWNRRAWTLQERLLSRRLMIFEGGELTWRCRGMTAYEDLPGVEVESEPDPFPWLSIKPQYLGLNARKGYVDGSISKSRDVRTIVVRSGTFTEYVKVIEQYTPRDMTYPGDVLGALAGLLRIFERSFRCPVIDNHGLPEALLDAAVLWLPMEKLKRRDLSEVHLPSWSWAGWVGRVSYEKPFTAITNEQDLLDREPKERGQERFRPLVRWYTVAGQRLRAINNNGLGIPLPLADGQTLPVEWDGLPPGIEDCEATQFSIPDPVLNNLNSTHLVFRTSISRNFQFMDFIRKDIHDYPLKFSFTSISESCHEESRPSIAGVVTLDGSSPLFLRRDSHAFIVLSEAEYLGFGDERVREYDDRSAQFPLYNVMLVEWNGSQRIARRLGLGRVYKNAWRRSNAYVRTVILG